MCSGAACKPDLSTGTSDSFDIPFVLQSAQREGDAWGGGRLTFVLMNMRTTARPANGAVNPTAEVRNPHVCFGQTLVCDPGGSLGTPKKMDSLCRSRAPMRKA